MTAGRVNPLAKVASRAVQLYCDWSPLPRGKYWLLRRSAGFLVAPVDDGLWVRVSGVSGFEWKALRRQPGERVTADLFRKLLRPGATVLDVGANVGYYALLAAREVGPDGRVIAFEATPAVAARLAENVKLNALGNVTVVHAAVCDRAGEIEFRLQDDDSEGNSLVNFATDWPTVKVPAVSLDDYAAAHNIDRVDVMKVDVEGAEPMVLAGAKRLLSGPTPPVLILESNPEALKAGGSSPADIRERLAGFGYRCFGVEQLTQGADPVWNIVAVHPTHDRSGLTAAAGISAMQPL
jgi:FkbM family methyltransferase